MTNSHNLVNKSINILSKQLCFSNSTNLKIFLGSNTVVNMAANMAVRSMYNYRMWIYSETPTGHDKNIQYKKTE